MGQTTTGSAASGARGQNVAEEFAALQDLLGDWIVDEFVFRTQNEPQNQPRNVEPIVNTGRTTCRAAIGRLAMIVITDISTSLEQTIQLQTFDPRQARYELALVDSDSDTGIVVFTGQTVNQRSSAEIRAQFGKAAMEVREWNLAAGQNVGQAGLEFDRIVENKISADRWVIQYFNRAQQGEFLVKQQVLTRSNPGCQPQVGCELGCAGLIGCQEGCQGIQGLQGLQGQALGCACSSQTMGQAQVLTQSQLMTQSPLLTQSAVIPPQLIQPVVTQLPLTSLPLTQLPLIGVPQPVLVVAPTCVRVPVRPPLRRAEHGGK